MGIFSRYKKFSFHNEQEKMPVPIVGDAAVAASIIADGKLIPVVIIDTRDRPDLDELIRLHQHLPPGDVDFQWGTRPGAIDQVDLFLFFKRPIETNAILEFDILKRGPLVEQILRAKVFYLQAGRPGDRFVTTPDAPKIYVEVSETGFRPHWDKLFRKRVVREMKSTGLNRTDAKRAAIQAIEEMRAIGQIRMKRN